MALGLARMRRSLPLLVLGLSLASASSALAAPGDLDPTFSADGITTQAIASTSSSASMATSVAVQPDGKIVAAGHTGGFSGGDLVVTRFNADGTPDPAFNSGNARVFNVGSSDEFGVEVALLADGKILQVASVDLALHGWFGLARYTAGGDPDLSFDTDGAVTTNWGPEFDGVGVRGVAVDQNTVADPADDKYIVVGFGTEVATSKVRMLVARYDANGALDNSFSTDGKAVISFDDNAYPGDVVLQSDKIVVGGHTATSPTGSFAAARLDESGALDPEFGGANTGKFTQVAPGTGFASAFDFIEQPDGKLLLANQVEDGSKVGIARLTPGGLLDATFDTDGIVVTTFSGVDHPQPYELRVQPDGDILLGGSAFGNSTSHLLLARYTPAGALDPGFSGDGIVIDNQGDHTFGRAIALQGDGKIVLGGAIDATGGSADPSFATNADLAVLRFEGDPPATAEAPANTFLPSIPPGPAARRTAGQTLVGQAGTWTGTQPIDFDYIWLRCNRDKPSECEPATQRGDLAPYKLVEDDIGHRIRLGEIATNAQGSASAISEPTAVVSGVLANTEKPRIWGPLYRKGKLNAVPGGWDGPQPLTFAYAWESCNAKGEDCKQHGKEATQSIAKADVGRRFSVTVAAVDARGAVGIAKSEPTPPVGPRPEWPALRPTEKKKGGFSFLKIDAAKKKLKGAGLCFATGQACGFRMPAVLELDRNGLQDVPKKYRPYIRSPRVYEQGEDPGTEIGIGEELELEVYDASRNELCKKYIDADINDVKVKLGTNPEKVFEELGVEGCPVTEIVRTPSGAISKPFVHDINRDRSGKGFIVYIWDPLPKREYKEVPQVDTDGDGLWDQWESEGVDVNKDGYIDLDLPKMGADPRHKDIFMEIDHMENHPIDQAGMTDVIEAFKAAPVQNPDGRFGIYIHIDNGPESIMNPRTGERWNELSDQDELPHREQLGSTDTNGNYDWGPFQTLKTTYFHTYRTTVFRYVVSLHTFAGTNIGRARDMPDVEKLGFNLDGPSDMIVAANQPCPEATAGHCPLTPRQQGVNLMHELGHLLGLGHGGRTAANGQPDIVNGKPNYLSIMNYLFSFNGLKRIDGTLSTDYSRFTDAQFAIDNKLVVQGSLYALNESSLNEKTTTRATGFANQFTSGYVCTPPDGKKVLKDLAALNQQIDWNCRNGLETPAVSQDVNNDGSLTTLVSREDWSVLKFTGGAVGAFNAAPPRKEESALAEPTAPELLRAAQVIAGDAVAPTVKLTVAKPNRKGKVKLAIVARDNRALGQLVVLLDGEQRTFKLRGRKAKRRITVGPGRHRVRVEAQDAVGTYSKAATRKFVARKARKK